MTKLTIGCERSHIHISLRPLFLAGWKMTKNTDSGHSSRKIRILIVDDHELVRRGIRALLSRRSRWEICGEAINGEEAVRKVKELRPDLVTLDVNMPAMNGIEAAREIRRMAPTTKIIFLTMHEHSQIDLTARQAGADAVISKADTAASLVATIHHLFDMSSSAIDNAIHDAGSGNLEVTE